jgi:TPR repeat protein
MYAEGRGTEKNPEAAYSWITAAAMAGDTRGRDLLHSLEKVLNASQIAEARERASRLRLQEPQFSASFFAQ